MIVILSPKFLNIGQNVSSNTLVVENENKQKEKKIQKIEFRETEGSIGLLFDIFFSSNLKAF